MLFICTPEHVPLQPNHTAHTICFSCNTLESTNLHGQRKNLSAVQPKIFAFFPHLSAGSAAFIYQIHREAVGGDSEGYKEQGFDRSGFVSLDPHVVRFRQQKNFG